MMGLHTHRWLSSDESSSLSAYKNNGTAPKDTNVVGHYYWLVPTPDSSSRLWL